MGRLFGTDGVRGLANGDLTPERVMAISVAAARVLAEREHTGRPVAVVGRDPRASGEMLRAAVVAGLTSAGADVLDVDVVPTPALAHLTRDLDADFGVMLSASHNPMPDNGVKLFARGGHKLPDQVEDEIEAALSDPGTDRPTGAAIGRVRTVGDALDRYAAHLLAGDHRLSGLRVVVDCANGAAARVAPMVYQKAGADVVAIGACPDGLNINDGCGSTHLDSLIERVAEHGADAGIAHDGDADRCLAVTADGSVVDGDAILAICALALREAGGLAENTVVATVMSNLGLHRALREHGIGLVTTPVGDRYVLAALRERGLSLGGEQSGHIVFADQATTGDGLLTALWVLGRMTATGRSLAELASVVTRLPQVLVNVRVADKGRVAESDTVTDAVRAAQRGLGEDGRILMRPSGTEQIIRVMVEAPTDERAQEIAEEVARVIAAA